MFRYVQGRKFGITAGGGGGELVLPDQKGVAGVVPDAKIVGEWGGVEARRKKFSDIPFFTNFRTNVP